MFCVAFIDGKTFRQKETLRQFGCRWNGPSKVWTKKCDTEADAQSLQSMLDGLELTARIVYPDGHQVTPPRIERCPDAEKQRHAVIVSYGEHVAFVRSFICEQDASKLAKQIATRYPSNMISIEITTDYRRADIKWPELKAKLVHIQRSNFDRPKIGAQDRHP